MKHKKLTIHKIAQVDRICYQRTNVVPSIRGRCICRLAALGYLAAWDFLVANNAHQS